ncbi:hypothetical protein HDV00_010044 [Rhizophlyctis rosea]|nr:hypothetical protein HDV00_010044 [Rhizophlyctis rosea]
MSTVSIASSLHSSSNPILKHGTLILEPPNSRRSIDVDNAIQSPLTKEKKRSAFNLFSSKKKKEAERERNEREQARREREKEKAMLVLLVWVRSTNDIAKVAKTLKSRRLVDDADFTLPRGGSKSGLDTSSRTHTMLLGQLAQAALEGSPTLIAFQQNPATIPDPNPPLFISLPSYTLLTEIELGSACRFALSPTTSTFKGTDTHTFRSLYAHEYLEWTRVISGCIDFYWRVRQSEGDVSAGEGSTGSDSEAESFVSGRTPVWLKAARGLGGSPYQQGNGGVGTGYGGGQSQGGEKGKGKGKEREGGGGSDGSQVGSQVTSNVRSAPSVSPLLQAKTTVVGGTVSATQSMDSTLPKNTTEKEVPAPTPSPATTPSPPSSRDPSPTSPTSRDVPGSPYLQPDPSTLDLAHLPDDDDNSDAHSITPDTGAAAPSTTTTTPQITPQPVDFEVYDRERVQGVLNEAEARDALEKHKKAVTTPASEKSQELAFAQNASNVNAKRYSLSSDSGIGSGSEPSSSEDEGTVKRGVREKTPDSVLRRKQGSPTPMSEVSSTSSVPSVTSSAARATLPRAQTSLPAVPVDWSLIMSGRRLSQEVEKRRSIDMARTSMDSQSSVGSSVSSATTRINSRPVSVASAPVGGGGGAMPNLPVDWNLIMSGRRLSQEVEKRRSVDLERRSGESERGHTEGILSIMISIWWPFCSSRIFDLLVATMLPRTSLDSVRSSATAPVTLPRVMSAPQIANNSSYLPAVNRQMLVAGRPVDPADPRRSLDDARGSLGTPPTATTIPARPPLLHRPMSMPVTMTHLQPSPFPPVDWSLMMSAKKLEEVVNKRRSVDLESQVSETGRTEASDGSNVTTESMETWPASKTDLTSVPSLGGGVSGVSASPTNEFVHAHEMDVHVDVKEKAVNVDVVEVTTAGIKDAHLPRSAPVHNGVPHNRNETYPRGRPTSLLPIPPSVKGDPRKYAPSTPSALSSPPLSSNGSVKARVVGVRKEEGDTTRETNLEVTTTTPTPNNRLAAVEERTLGKKFSFEVGDDSKINVADVKGRMSLDAHMDRSKLGAVDVSNVPAVNTISEVGAGDREDMVKSRRGDGGSTFVVPTATYAVVEEEGQWLPKRKSIFSLFKKGAVKEGGVKEKRQSFEMLQRRVEERRSLEGVGGVGVKARLKGFESVGEKEVGGRKSDVEAKGGAVMQMRKSYELMLVEREERRKSMEGGRELGGKKSSEEVCGKREEGDGEVSEGKVVVDVVQEELNGNEVKEDVPLSVVTSVDVKEDEGMVESPKEFEDVMDKMSPGFTEQRAELPRPKKNRDEVSLTMTEHMELGVEGSNRAGTAVTTENDSNMNASDEEDDIPPVFSTTPPPNGELARPEGSPSWSTPSSTAPTLEEEVVRPPSPVSSEDLRTTVRDVIYDAEPEPELELKATRPLWAKVRPSKDGRFSLPRGSLDSLRGKNSATEKVDKRQSLDQGGFLRWLKPRNTKDFSIENPDRTYSITATPPVTSPTSSPPSTPTTSPTTPTPVRITRNKGKQPEESELTQMDSRIRAVIATYQNPTNPYLTRPRLASIPPSAPVNPAPRSSLEETHPIPEFAPPEMVVMKSRKDGRPRQVSLVESPDGPPSPGVGLPRISLEDPAGPRVWNEKKGRWEDLVTRVVNHHRRVRD